MRSPVASTGAAPATEPEAAGRSGGRTRENFLNEIGAEMAHAPPPTLLGIIRVRDYERIAAFDRPGADALCLALADRARAALRRGVLIAKVDHDCLALWFRRTPEAQATQELRALAYVLKGEIGVGDVRITPELALAGALFPRDATDAEGLLSRALSALPRQAVAASDRVALFSTESSEDARSRFKLEQDLRAAIGKDQFFLRYQPIVDLAEGRLIGAEALLRWRRPGVGIVPPAEFVPVLEETGLVEGVGLWVLNEACREARNWRGLAQGALTVAVNLSAVQVRESLPLTIARTLERHRLTPERVEVELTETAAMQDQERTRLVLEQLKNSGVGVALDDFGAGYSSLSYLKNLPFTKLKIDREFVTKVHERPDSQAICAALVALAKGLRIRVLAEGVEERAEIETLLRLGCACFQGYFFSPPLPPDEFAQLVADSRWLGGLGFPQPSPTLREAFA